jgi:hypothetical protein
MTQSGGSHEFTERPSDAVVEDEVEIVGSSNPGPDDHSDAMLDVDAVGSSNPGPDDHSALVTAADTVGSSNPGPEDHSEPPTETELGDARPGSSDPGPDDHLHHPAGDRTPEQTGPGNESPRAGS